MKEIKKIEKIISSVEYVSFDIFDTLITRNLNKPTDLFKIVQKKLDSSNFEIKDFYEQRIIAERIARKNNRAEISLEDIYIILKDIYGYDLCEKLKSIEIETELEVCEINRSFWDTYNYCKNNYKKIVIITDMYLNKDVIEKILERNQIYYDKLFVSSELGITKSSGLIYQYVLKELNILPSQIFHFGDNKKSDIRKARENGIKCKHVINKKNSKRIFNEYMNNLDYSILQNFICNHSITENDYFGRLGYQIFGPLLYGFSIWLRDMFNSQNISKVFFLSRDGYIMQKAYEIVSNNFETRYFYASRRALIVPTLYTINTIDELINKMFFRDQISMKNFFKKVGLDIDNHKLLLKKYGYSENTIFSINNMIKDESFLKFFNEIKNYIINNSKEELKTMLNYFEANDFKDKLAIVDIGWYGNMQNAIECINRTQNLNADINGFYIGIVPDSDKQEKYKMNGFLFEKAKNEDLFMRKQYFNGLLEMFFQAHHGSVKKYLDDTTVEMYDYEYKDSVVENYITNFQQGALRFVKDFNNYNKNNIIEINERISFINYETFANNPTLKDIEHFKKIDFYDDNVLGLIPKKGLLYYLFNPQKFVNEFKDSSWKIAFLKRLFKVKFNYHKFILYLRKLYKKEF